VRQIFETEVPDSIDLKVEIASSPYVTQAIFNKYIDEVLIPAIISNRGLPVVKINRQFSSVMIALLIILMKYWVNRPGAGFLSLPTHRTLRISLSSSMSSYLESSKKRRSINVEMTPCGEK
jgi:predicted transcriptional regulator